MKITLAPHGTLTFTLKDGKQWEVLGNTSFGVHLYGRKVNGIYVFGQRTSNAALNPDGTGFAGKIYFDSMQVDVDPGMSIVPEVLGFNEKLNGSTYTIASSQGGGLSHVFLSRWASERRFAICPVGREAEAAQYLKLTRLQYPSPVLNYGPTMSRLPMVNRAQYRTEFQGLTAGLDNALHLGQPFYAENLANLQAAFGFYQPDGLAQADEPGGFEIDTNHGYEQDPAADEFRRRMHRCHIDRMPVFAYNRLTGEAISLYGWTFAPHRNDTVDGRQELTCFLQGSWGSYTEKQYNTGNCPYETKLRKEFWTDDAHVIRYLEKAIPLFEYTKDPMILDDLVMVAENARYGEWSDRSDEIVTPPWTGAYIYPTLKQKLLDTSKHPNDGSGALDRAYAWMMYLGAAILKYKGPANWQPWGQNMIRLAKQTYDRWGILQNEAHDTYFPDDYTGTQTFHSGLIAHGLFALCTQLGNLTVAKQIIPLFCSSVYDKLAPIPNADTPTTVGPCHWLATHKGGVPLGALQAFDLQHQGGDPAHVWNALALCYRLTGDKHWLEVALKQWHPHPDLQARYAWCKAANDRSWTAEYEACLEQVLGIAA